MSLLLKLVADYAIGFSFPTIVFLLYLNGLLGLLLLKIFFLPLTLSFINFLIASSVAFLLIGTLDLTGGKVY